MTNSNDKPLVASRTSKGNAGFRLPPRDPVRSDSASVGKSVNGCSVTLASSWVSERSSCAAESSRARVRGAERDRVYLWAGSL